MQIIVRLDQVARAEELHDRLYAASWDLSAFDEAHKLSAHFASGQPDPTKRYADTLLEALLARAELS